MAALSERVTIYTDGACSGNPGPGGWAALVVDRGVEREVSGAEPHTTNNRMELLAAISALDAVAEARPVDLYTDSQYVRQGITTWIEGWKRKGWRTAGGTPVKNEDLWRRLDVSRRRHDVTWHWVKGHADDHRNNQVDGLARKAIERMKAGRG